MKQKHKYEINVDDYVVVETVRGQELGHVIKPVEEVNEEKLDHELKSIIRVATKKDIANYLDNVDHAEVALVRAKEIIVPETIEPSLLSSYLQVKVSKKDDNRIELFKTIYKILLKIKIQIIIIVLIYVLIIYVI